MNQTLEILRLHRIYHPAEPLCGCGWSPAHKPATRRGEEDAHLEHFAQVLAAKAEGSA